LTAALHGMKEVIAFLLAVTDAIYNKYVMTKLHTLSVLA